MRAAMQFRSKLTPYLYTSARRAYDTGIAIVSPLYYYWPKLEAAYAAPQAKVGLLLLLPLLYASSCLMVDCVRTPSRSQTQYMLGDDIMAVPVVKPILKGLNVTKGVEVWIPPGEWIDWQTGQVAFGPRVVNRSFTIHEMGVFVKSGAIIVTKVRACACVGC